MSEEKAENVKFTQPPYAPPAQLDPLTAMRQEMDRVFDQFGSSLLGHMPSFSNLLGGNGSEGLTRALAPTADVHETADAVEIDMELPGVLEKDIAVTVQDGVLRIKGERRYESSDDKGEGKQAHMVERSYGRFERAFRLPDTVDVDAVSAELENGVLKVRAAKTEQPQPSERRIEIGSS